MSSRLTLAGPRSRTSAAVPATMRCRVAVPLDVSTRSTSPTVRSPGRAESRPGRPPGVDLTVHSIPGIVDRMVHSIGSRLAGRTALVTGATSNIGRAIAVAFAAEGALVAVSGRDRDRGAAVVKEIEAAGGRARFVPVDLDGSASRSAALAAIPTPALGRPVY